MYTVKKVIFKYLQYCFWKQYCNEGRDTCSLFISANQQTHAEFGNVFLIKIEMEMTFLILSLQKIVWFKTCVGLSNKQICKLEKVKVFWPELNVEYVN